MSTTIKILHIDETDPAALHLHYSGQTEQQPCYVELDCETGELSADSNGEIGNGVPSRVWHGACLRWRIPCLLPDVANELMDEIAPLSQTLVDGYSVEWDGNNHSGRHVTDESREAADEIERLCAESGGEDREVQAWDAGDWLQGGEPIVTADTTDEQLVTLAETLRDDAHEHGTHVLFGLDDYLSDLRDAARDAANDGNEAVAA